MTEDLFTAEEAAEQVGMAVGTIYSWVSRGHLKPVIKRGRFKMFRLANVYACERDRKRKHRRRSRRDTL